MAAEYGMAAILYGKALRDMSPEALRNWIDYLDDLAKLGTSRQP